MTLINLCYLIQTRYFILPSIVCEFNSDIKGGYISKREGKKKNEKVYKSYMRVVLGQKKFLNKKQSKITSLERFLHKHCTV